MKAHRVVRKGDKPEDDLSASDLRTLFVFSPSGALASGEARRKVK